MDCRRDLMPSAAGQSRRERRCGRVLRWRRWKGPPKGRCQAAASPTDGSSRSTWNSMVANELRGVAVLRCGGAGGQTQIIADSSAVRLAEKEAGGGECFLLMRNLGQHPRSSAIS